MQGDLMSFQENDARIWSEEIRSIYIEVSIERNHRQFPIDKNVEKNQVE